MDADTRPNSAVMAYVGPRGATFRDLERKLGWGRERLEAVLRALVRSRVLVRDAGRYLPVEVVKERPVSELHQKLIAASRKGCAASLEKSRAAREARYREILAMRDRGVSFTDIARHYGKQDMRVTVMRAVRWRAGGGK